MIHPLPPDQQPASALAVFIDAIDEALPQTQCTRCGYPDCRGYAEAVATGAAAINQCPPGGEEGIARLAAITGRATLPLNPDHGVEAPRVLARIDENWCIGCTLCIKVCPTDAILGANKRMHTIIAEACTGCELCLPVCPVDCIELDNASGEATGWEAWSHEQAEQARNRYQKHSNRRTSGMRKPAKGLQTTPAGDEDRLAVSSPSAALNNTSTADSPSAPTPMPSKVTNGDTTPATPTAPADKKAMIAAILAKARQQRGSPN
ncbi:electron transport complex protein RnfB [Comamonas sp. 4034]